MGGGPIAGRKGPGVVKCKKKSDAKHQNESLSPLFDISQYN